MSDRQVVSMVTEGYTPPVAVVTVCEHCGGPIEQPRTGRPRRFCRAACRVAAHRKSDRGANRESAASAGPGRAGGLSPEPRGLCAAGPADAGEPELRNAVALLGTTQKSRPDDQGDRVVCAAQGPSEFRDTPGLVICAITARPELPDAAAQDLDEALAGLWSPRFPTADLLSAAAGMFPGRAPWVGEEGPRPRVVIAPGAVAIEAPDLAKRERAQERIRRARLIDADVLAQRQLPDGTFPNDKVATRAGIRAWSRKSRANMVRALCELDYSALLADVWRVPAMLTFTYPGDWLTVAPDADTVKAQMRAFRKRWARAWGVPLVGVWKLEFQRRGAPHWHVLTTPPHGRARHATDRHGRPVVGAGLPFRHWLSVVWADVLDHPDPQQRRNNELAGTGIDFAEGLRASDPKRVAVYFLKHGSFAGKAYQNRPPAEWTDQGAGPGRFWGYWGLQRRKAIVELEPAEQVRAARIMRRWARAQGTTREVRVPRGLDTTTGRLRLRRLRRRVNRLPNGAGWLSVNDGALFASQLARALAV